MIRTIYYIILIYFILGGISFYLINHKKEKDVAKKSYTKFITYFFIINILFFGITIHSVVFQYISYIIIIAGIYEIINLFFKSGYSHKSLFILFLMIYFILSLGFLSFTHLNKNLILFSFLVLSIFDSFSQITGQFFGKHKIISKISPNKTIEGTIGGFIIAMGSGLLMRNLYDGFSWKTIIMTTGIIIFAFLGDLLASLYKRKYNVKDYSKIIPGNGGFLDRFDSLIAGGAWVCVGLFLLNL